MSASKNIFSDLGALRLNPAGATLLRTEQVLSHVPVRKPARHEFVRVHPDAEMAIETAVLEDKEERETYFVHPDMWEALRDELTPKLLVTAITRQGTLLLWPLSLPDERGRLTPWGETAREAAELAKTAWVRMASDIGLGAYRVHRAAGDLPEPDWPDKPLSGLMEIAFRGRVIAGVDHPFVRRLRGLV